MLKPGTGFRPATYNDAHFAAAVASAAEPNRPEVAEELLEKWINTEKGSQVRRFIVQEDGVDRCWISLVQPASSGLATYLNLLIPAANEKMLPDAVVFGEGQAREMGASELICVVHEDNRHAVEWLRASGWTQERRERFWRLDLEANADRIREFRTAAQQRLKTTDVA